MEHVRHLRWRRHKLATFGTRVGVTDIKGCELSGSLLQCLASALFGLVADDAVCRGGEWPRKCPVLLDGLLLDRDTRLTADKLRDIPTLSPKTQIGMIVAPYAHPSWPEVRTPAPQPRLPGVGFACRPDRPCFTLAPLQYRQLLVKVSPLIRLSRFSTSQGEGDATAGRDYAQQRKVSAEHVLRLPSGP